MLEMRTFSAWLLCCHLTALAHAYSSGAPRSACSTLMPRHGTTQHRSSDSPYIVSVEGDGTYKPGQRLTVKVKGEDGRRFRGFMLHAQTVDGGGTMVGTFTPKPYRTSNVCGRGALTHRHSGKKADIETVWRPSDDTSGDIIFIATVVEVYHTFWVNVTSLIVHDLNALHRAILEQTTPSNLTINSAKCHETQLAPIPAQRPHVAILCTDDGNCPCTWRCCSSCNDVTGVCGGHAICRQPLANQTETSHVEDEDED